MIQVEVNDEYNINQWLQQNHENIKITDIKIACSDERVAVMVVYVIKE